MYVQAGAGIVADSNPENEYQNIKQGKGIIQAAENAFEGEV